MIEPDFQEPQLQQTVNIAFLMWAKGQGRIFKGPIIPSLPEEEFVGWDSAFFFPWFFSGPNLEHYGCNFFLQYKLSSLVQGPRGGQYTFWNQPYYRFRIPYMMKQGTKYVPDFHQLYALRELARAKYLVYYATNQVISRNELFVLADNQTLLDNTPLLDVADITHDHHYVTFIPSSRHFYLHTEAVACQRPSIMMVQDRFIKTPRRPLSKDNKLTFELIRPYLKSIQGAETFVAYYKKLDQAEERNDGPIQIRQWLLLRAGLRRFMNIEMMRYGEWIPTQS